MISYYVQVAPVLLPLLAQRPVTRKRWPDGVGATEGSGRVFFAKNLPRDAGLGAPLPHPARETHQDYPVVGDLATLTGVFPIKWIAV